MPRFTFLVLLTFFISVLGPGQASNLSEDDDKLSSSRKTTSSSKKDLPLKAPLNPPFKEKTQKSSFSASKKIHQETPPTSDTSSQEEDFAQPSSSSSRKGKPVKETSSSLSETFSEEKSKKPKAKLNSAQENVVPSKSFTNKTVPTLTSKPTLKKEKEEFSKEAGYKTPHEKKSKPRVPSTDPLPHKSSSSSTSDLKTPVGKTTHPRKPATEPSKRPKPNTTVDIYGRQQKVSQQFLSPTKTALIKQKITPPLQQFFGDYDVQTPRASTLDITGLSARARIKLLMAITIKKLSKLPTDITNGNFNQKCAEFPENSYWRVKKSEYNGYPSYELIDRFPTTFKIGDSTYKLENGATRYQPGSGRLYGLFLGNPHTAEKYEKVIEPLTSLKKEALQKVGKSLLDQKKSGAPITKFKNPSTNHFLNGFNLLLDYEVARRLPTGTEEYEDQYKTLPLLPQIKYLLENFDNTEYLKEFFLGKKQKGFVSSHEGTTEDVSNYLGYSNHPTIVEITSPVAGRYRDTAIYEFNRKLPRESVRSSRCIRDTLRGFHKSEEDSNDTYSGTFEEIEVYDQPESNKDIFVTTQAGKLASEESIQDAQSEGEEGEDDAPPRLPKKQ